MMVPVGDANWDAPPRSMVAGPPKSNGNNNNSKRRGGGNNNNNNGGTWSPRSCLLVRDFLVPCLDSGCYGDDLQWLNRRRGVFLIRWTHQGSKSFNREGPNVFRDWSILKRKWDDRDPNRLSKAKQRVRAAFRKLPNVRRINDGAAPHRIYRIKDVAAYLKPWKEPKEKKRKKKRQPPCGCDLGCVDCCRDPRGHHEQEQGAMSSATAGEEEEGDDDDDYMDDWEEDYKGVSLKSGVSSLSSVGPNGGVWSSLHSLTEAKDDQDDSSPASSCSPADMEAVQALLSMRHGRLLQAPALAPPTVPGQLAAPSQHTAAPMTTCAHVAPMAAQHTEAKDQLTVSAELRVTSNGVMPSPSDGESGLAPHSFHVFKGLLAAALSSAPQPAQPETVTGDSPHMFWADAAPARHGEQQQPQQLTTTAVSAEGSFPQDFGAKSEPVASYEAGKSAGAAMAACTAAAHSGGWTDRSTACSSASSSWLDRNEPARPDGCWTTR